MIPCPGCGAGLRFDIASQQLKCDYCGTTQAVKDAADDRQARPDTIDVTVYTCPQCGGEIYSTQNEAASFCTFCGASVMLEGRMTQARRPLRIIPFQKTKEDCKAIYTDLAKRAWFTPKELKDPEYLEKFRGIYLPFWTYSFEQKGPVRLVGSREEGDYTEHLSLTCDLDVSYDGISYDASSAFNDELCRFITPFNTASVKDFLPGYMSGFYADTADVDSSLYLKDAERDANDETVKNLEREYAAQAFGRVHINMPKDKSRKLHTELKDVTLAMYPVWFLTYRAGDRVAYAVVNGETGKIAADLPVERRRYLLGSLILALPIFLLLIMMPVITAPTLLLISVILGITSFVIYLLSSREINRRENRLDDKGYQAAIGNPDISGNKEDKDSKEKNKKKGTPWAAAASTKSTENRFLTLLRTALPLLAGIIGLIVWLGHPVSDIYYYGGAILVLACICFTLLGLISRFNLLTTRPIPQFHERTGGDDHG